MSLSGRTTPASLTYFQQFKYFSNSFTLMGRLPLPRHHSKLRLIGLADRTGAIALKVLLELTESELADLHKAIADETPQMRNALEEVSLVRTIECEVTFSRAPLLGFISRMSFSRSLNDPQAHDIFRIDREAAYEIAVRNQEAKQLHSQLRMFDLSHIRIDSEEWRMLKERHAPAESILPRPRYARMSGETIDIMNRFVRSSETLDEFRDTLAAYAVDLRSRSNKLLNAENKKKFDTFSGQSSVVPGYVTQVANSIKNLKVHQLSEQREPIGQDEASRILRLKTSRGQANVLSAIQAIVVELLGVKIDAFSSDRQPPRGETVAAELDVDDFLVQVNGSGIREALRLILDFEFVQPDILLVEEPEVHLHPGLEIAMMQYLRQISARCQIFLTTHSTNFLDIAELNSVYLVTRDESTHVQLLDVGEAEEAIPQELGIRLSSLFMYDRLVFVEGPSDEQILRSFASCLGINLSRASVGFVTTGGARNFGYYANGATLAFLAKRRVQL